MRFIEIAIFVFIFSYALSIANTLYPYVSISPPEITYPQNITITPSGTDISTGFTVLQGISLFFQTFYQATIALPYLLNSLGVPGLISNAITTIVWLIYILVIIQFLTGRYVGG